MGKRQIPIRLILRLIPAIIKGVSGLAEAASKDSDGGKRITKAEAQDVAEDVLDTLRPILIEELQKGER